MSVAAVPRFRNTTEIHYILGDQHLPPESKIERIMAGLPERGVFVDLRPLWGLNSDEKERYSKLTIRSVSPIKNLPSSLSDAGDIMAQSLLAIAKSICQVVKWPLYIGTFCCFCNCCDLIRDNQPTLRVQMVPLIDQSQQVASSATTLFYDRPSEFNPAIEESIKFFHTRDIQAVQQSVLAPEAKIRILENRVGVHSAILDLSMLEDQARIEEIERYQHLAVASIDRRNYCPQIEDGHVDPIDACCLLPKSVCDIAESIFRIARCSIYAATCGYCGNCCGAFKDDYPSLEVQFHVPISPEQIPSNFTRWRLGHIIDPAGYVSFSCRRSQRPRKAPARQVMN